MCHIYKKDGLPIAVDMKSCLISMLLIIVFVGCSSEVEPPLQQQALAPTAQTDDKKVLIEASEYEDEPGEYDESDDFKAGSDDDVESNVPPEIISLKLFPLVVYPGTKVKVLAEGRDNEGEELEFYYRWQRNEKYLPAEESEELDTTGFNKGDLITAFVIPFDGEKEGREAMSPSLLIANRPPDIISAPLGRVENGVFVYEVEATDPEGDDLTFSLEGSPVGMIIDSATGRVEWTIPADAKGPFSIKVVVSDGTATTFQGFNIGEIVRELR